MIIQAGDLGVKIDTGHSESGARQRLEGNLWKPYRKDGKPVCWPIKLMKLEPGRYRVEE